ncbi:uncharacterized protein LOC123553309 [Mercenaria mercenaria]|uniref:uncharacterized protein LOC123553309 n=1 Tax=Mercenaria mercenaria TaxID=6596 RepID=UPI00234E7959|nr:uncharacterized protein LOC123553309 [Mercenaria mercenaria]
MIDMEDANLFEYEYTMPDSPESNRLVINMDDGDASGDACSVSDEFIRDGATATSSGDPLPSFDTFGQTPSMSHISCWYSMPSTCNTELRSTVESPHTQSASQLIESSGNGQESVSVEKQESADQTFFIDSILGLEQHCYNPRHSTPAKDVYNTFTHQTTGTGSSLNSNQLQTAKISTNAHVYKRQVDKPPYSYVAMVIVAILNSEEKQLTLAGIREKLMDMFPFFGGEYSGWKNSIRHALSNSKCFYKVEKRNELDTTTVFVWRVNTEFVKPNHTFNRYSKGHNYESYKLTLQEELGLPPYEHTTGVGPLNKDDIQLPPKPCFQADSLSLAVNVSDDFLNARNDSVPTPQSTVSDLDSVLSVSSSAKDVKPSLKRKRTEDYHSAQQTTYASKRQYVPMEYQYPYYGYQQSMEGVRPYDPYFGYYPTTNFASGHQWSHDLYQYGNPQQTSVQPLSNNNDDVTLRQWWFNQACYQGMVPSSFQSASYANNCDWYPRAALDLTKMDKKSDK